MPRLSCRSGACSPLECECTLWGKGKALVRVPQVLCLDSEVFMWRPQGRIPMEYSSVSQVYPFRVVASAD